jgi:hypothetical protein
MPKHNTGKQEFVDSLAPKTHIKVINRLLRVVFETKQFSTCGPGIDYQTILWKIGGARRPVVLWRPLAQVPENKNCAKSLMREKSIFALSQLIHSRHTKSIRHEKDMADHPIRSTTKV